MAGLTATLPAVAASPTGPSQRASCPTCGEVVPGLMAGCWKLACIRAECDAETALDRAIEMSE